MKRSDLLKLPVGSAQLVVAHAEWRRQRGHRPSMSFVNERDPKKALKFAQVVIKADQWSREVAGIGKIFAEKRSFESMDELMLKVVLRHIVITSSSEEEILARVQKELGMSPEFISVDAFLPDDNAGREIRELVRGLGGLIMKNGAVTSVVAETFKGETIFV